MKDFSVDLSIKPVKVKWSRDFMLKTAHERTVHRLSLSSLTEDQKAQMYQTLYEQEIRKIQKQM